MNRETRIATRQRQIIGLANDFRIGCVDGRYLRKWMKKYSQDLNDAIFDGHFKCGECDDVSPNETIQFVNFRKVSGHGKYASRGGVCPHCFALYKQSGCNGLAQFKKWKFFRGDE